jgi:hypothetical protein
VAVDGPHRAELEIAGGVGFLPVTVTGLASPRGWTLRWEDGSAERPFDQSVHGRDFWQAMHDPASGTWRFTANLPVDSPGDVAVTRRLRVEPAPDR